MPDALMVSGTEIFSCLTVTDEAILLKRLHEILLILHPGTTPHDDMVCHKSDLSCRERGHTLCTVARSTARNKTLPLTLAHSHSSLIQAAINITQSLTLIQNTASARLTGAGSAAEVAALQTLIRLDADAAE